MTAAGPRLRPARLDDAAAIAAIYAPHVLAGTVSFETEPPDAAAIAERMAGDGLYPWLVADEGGEVLGYAYAAPFAAREAYRWAVETTIYIAEAGQRRGLGRRLYGALLATLGAQGFAQAISRIALPNHASVALHEALGSARSGCWARSAGRRTAGSMSACGNARWTRMRTASPPRRARLPRATSLTARSRTRPVPSARRRSRTAPG